VGVDEELPAPGRLGRGARPWRNGARDFHKEKRSTATHDSTTDPDARLYRKADGRERRLGFMGHVPTEIGWIKSSAGLAKTRHRGLARVGWMSTLTAAAYNLVRIAKLVAATP
jgi:hypothetical protein